MTSTLTRGCAVLLGALCLGISSAAQAREIELRVRLAPGEQACTSRVRVSRTLQAQLEVTGGVILEPLVVNVLGRERRGLRSTTRALLATTTPPPPALRPDRLSVEVQRTAELEAFFPGPLQVCVGNPRGNRPLRVQIEVETR